MLTDTTPEAAAVQVRLLREAGPQRRCRMMCELSEMVFDLARSRLRRESPLLSEQQIEQRLAAIVHGPALAERIGPGFPGGSRMNIGHALQRATEILGKLGLEWYVGGSVASSIYGVPRSTADAEVGAVIGESSNPALLAAASPDFYVSETAVREAIARGSSFNLIHLATTYKVDVFAVRPGSLGELAAARRQRRETDFGDLTLPLWVASPEDVVLLKLDWYRRGGEASDQQWRDILGVLRVQGEAIDRGYLEAQAGAFHLDGLWARAEAESRAG